MSGLINGERLLARRKELGLSQEKLAKKCGISTNRIRAYEKSQGNPTAETLACLSRTLRVNIEWLLGLTTHRSRRVTKADLTEDQLELLAAWESSDFKALNALFWKKNAEQHKP